MSRSPARSQPAPRAWLLVPLLSSLLAAVACQSTGRALAAPPVQPPLAELVSPPSYLTPRSQVYRVAVRPFVDQTGKAASLADAAADVLVTALHAESRFALYEASRDLGPAAVPAIGAAPESASEARPPTRDDSYERLASMVDGVLESHVTAVQLDAQGNGSFEVDYRMVDPHSRMVVTSGSATMSVRRGSLVRRDFQRLATALGGSFVTPERMAAHEIAVRELDLEGGEVKLTLSGGEDAQVRRGAVGFVVEPDAHARLERYLAKFVVVTVFPEAAVAIVVEHCNAVGRCRAQEAIEPVQQAQNVHIGSRVRFK